LDEAFADNGTHRAADKAEFECGNHDGQAIHKAFHDDHRVVFAGGFTRGGQAFGVFFAVFEFQRVGRFDIGGDFFAALFVQKQIEAFARRKRVVMVTLWANSVVLLKLGRVDGCRTGRAFVPQTFWDVGRAFIFAAVFDFGR